MRKALGVLLAAILVVGACGGDSDKDALVEAVENLSTGNGVTIRLSLDADEESLQTAFAQDPDLPEDAAATLLGSSLTFGSNYASEPAEAKSELVFELGGREAVAMISDGYDLYLHADVPYIMETFGIDPALLDEQLAQLPPGLEFARQAAQNEWIHLTGLEQLAAQAEAAGQGQGVPNLSAQQKRLVDGLAQALAENSEVTEGDQEGPGTHYEAKLDIKALADDIERLGNQFGQIPGGQGLSEFPTSEQELPEGDFILDAWVDDGTLTQVRIDFLKNLREFAPEEEVPEGLDRLGLVLEFDAFEETVEPPADAIAVSFEEILTALLTSGFGQTGVDAGGGGSATTADPCEEIAKLPAEQQAPFKDICPDL